MGCGASTNSAEGDDHRRRSSTNTKKKGHKDKYSDGEKKSNSSSRSNHGEPVPEQREDDEADEGLGPRPAPTAAASSGLQGKPLVQLRPGGMLLPPSPSNNQMLLPQGSQVLDSPNSQNIDSANSRDQASPRDASDARHFSASPPRRNVTDLPLRCATPPPSTLPLHPMSRIVPRKFTSSYDRHYRGSFEDPKHPEYVILSPLERRAAQLAETQSMNFRKAEGLAWPVKVTGHTGEIDITVLPLSAIRDEMLMRQEEVRLVNLRSQKRTRASVVVELEKMMRAVEECVNKEERFADIVSAGEEATTACLEVGLMKLAAILNMLSAVAQDLVLLQSDPEALTEDLHASVAQHFENEFDSLLAAEKRAARRQKRISELGGDVDAATTPAEKEDSGNISAEGSASSEMLNFSLILNSNSKKKTTPTTVLGKPRFADDGPLTREHQDSEPRGGEDMMIPSLPPESSPFAPPTSGGSLRPPQPSRNTSNGTFNASTTSDRPHIEENPQRQQEVAEAEMEYIRRTPTAANLRTPISENLQLSEEADLNQVFQRYLAYLNLRFREDMLYSVHVANQLLPTYK